MYQNSRCFISRKGTSAAGVREVKESPDCSVTGIMGTRRQDHPALDLEQGGTVSRDGWAVSREGCIPSGSVLQDWASGGKPQC